MATSIAGISLPNVEVINSIKTANIIPIPLPGADSDSNITFDALGVTRIIMVQGTITGEVSAIQTKVNAIEAVIDGEQDSVDFISDLYGTLQVKINSLNIIHNLPGNNATYQLQLIQGED